GHPHAGVTSGRCAGELLIPAGNHSLEIERAILEIPVASRDNLYAAVGHISVEIRNRSFQRVRGVFLCDGRGDHPQAEFLAFQSSLAVDDQCFEEIRFGLVEKTKVCTPRYVADDVHSGPPHLGSHRGYLSKSPYFQPSSSY